MSLKRIVGMLCYVVATFFLCLIVASAVNRIYGYRGYSVTEDIVVFAVLTILGGAGSLRGICSKSSVSSASEMKEVSE